MTVTQFVSDLASVPSTGAFTNPYNCYSIGIDASKHADKQRQKHLIHYLSFRLNSARTIFIAEAPGYQGTRFTGIAMTSERLILTKVLKEVDLFGKIGVFDRTSGQIAQKNAIKILGYAEPTATIMWDAISQKSLAREVVLWNTFPFHPYKAGSELSNRTPSVDEIQSHIWAVKSFVSLFSSSCKIVAIGKIAQNHLARIGISADHVNHPANGGAPKFRTQIQKYL